MLNGQESAEAIVRHRALADGRAEHEMRMDGMRAHDEHRKQNIPQGASVQRIAVKPREAGQRGPSSSSAQRQTPSCEGSTDLLEQVLERSNLLEALKRVESNKGAPGVDGVTVEQLRSYVQTHWADIRQQLLAGTYTPQPVRRVEIPKPGGGKRKLGIPTVNSFCTPPNRVLELEMSRYH